MRSMIVFIGLLTATPALAGYDSAYSDLNLENRKACVYVGTENADAEGSSVGPIECDGYGDYTVTFKEGDLRSFASFSTKIGDQCSLRQTFGGFKSVGKKIEWRLKDGVPIATIFRWTVSYDSAHSEKTKDWLVVTKLGDGNSCQFGYVEGGYPKANEKARWLADTAAEAFSCTDGIPIFFANPGTVTENITSGGCDH
jgi:hypothetical protein